MAGIKRDAVQKLLHTEPFFFGALYHTEEIKLPLPLRLDQKGRI